MSRANLMLMRMALRALAYQEQTPGKWLKPIGFMCFSFDERLYLWETWFRGGSGNVLCFERKEVPAGELDLLSWLKTAECYARTDINPRSDSQFELSVYPPDTWW